MPFTLCNKFLLHFVMSATLFKYFLPHFVIPDTLCNGFLSHFVIITKCIKSQVLGLKTWDAESRAQYMKPKIQNPGPGTLALRPKTKNQDLNLKSGTRIYFLYYILSGHLFHKLILPYGNINHKLMSMLIFLNQKLVFI